MILTFVLIGPCDYFGFGFTTLNRKTLYNFKCKCQPVLMLYFPIGCEHVGTKLNVEEHGETCKYKHSADPPKCQALHSGV